MDKCCQNKTTAFCGDCGADLQSLQLPALVEYLQKRAGMAWKTVREWRDKEPRETEERGPVVQGIERNTRTAERFESWAKQVGELIAKPTTDEPEQEG